MLFRSPDGRSVLLDWQLVVRGHHMHDVSYIVTTALSIGDRRNHERDLLAYYLDRLKAHGVAAAPDFEESWTEYKRCLVWGVYIGRSEEHTSELQSLMRISYAVFCLKKKKKKKNNQDKTKKLHTNQIENKKL